MKKKEEVSEKNKKNEILEAYYKVLEELKTQNGKNPQKVQTAKEEKVVVEKTNTLSPEKIVNGLAETKLQVSNSLDSLENQLMERFRLFNELQEAITISENKLRDIHAITVEADSLAALKIANEETAEGFDQEMEEQRLDLEAKIEEQREKWEKEKQEYEWSEKEERKRRKLEDKRKDEEQVYQVKVARQKDADEYETKKKALEQELEEVRYQANTEFGAREKVIAEKETKFDEYEAKIEAFPAQLQEEIQRAHQEAEAQVKRELEFKMQLSQKEIEGERELYKQRVEALEAKINEQENLIKQLQHQTQRAGEQVQDIAVKAVESASKSQSRGGFMEIPVASNKTVTAST